MGKQAILDRLRSRLVDRPMLPNLTGSWIVYADPVDQFIRTVEGIGGKVTLTDLPSAREYLLGALEQGRQRTTCSLLPCRGAVPEYSRDYRLADAFRSLPPGTVSLEQVADPHELADLDLVIDWGKLGVAENGAIWLDDVGVRQRVVHFITQHLLIALSVADIVHQMHQAYERLGDHRPNFGMFLAGPSKTADIEQSLVLGAHGSRTLHVLVVQ